MAAVAYLEPRTELEHAPIRVAFTVDEEGERRRRTSTSSASGRRTRTRSTAPSSTARDRPERSTPSRRDVTIRGRLGAPRHGEGTARKRESKLAADLIAALPRDGLSPETTEEREGFVHSDEASPASAEEATDRVHRPRPRRRADAEHVALLRRLADEVCEREPRARRSSARRSSTGTWAR